MASLKKGSKGKEVLTVQKALIAARIKPLVKATGTFDATTEAAVRAFQKKNGLKEDGVVGKNTQPKLLKMAKGPKLDLKMIVPDYAPLIKKATKEFIATKKSVLKVLVVINKNSDPALKKIVKEYNECFRGYVAAHQRWDKFAVKVSKDQSNFYKELRTDPWSAAEINKLVVEGHNSAHFENRMVEAGLYGFKRLNKILAENRKKMAA